MEYDKIDMGAYNLHLINTDKFKTITISINFREKINKEEITIRRFLFQMLSTSSFKYETPRLLQIELENLYSLSVNNSSVKFGNIINNYIDIKFLNEEYSDKSLLENSIDLLFELIFNPNVKNNKFDSKTFKNVKDIITLSIDSLKENPGMYANIKALENMDSKDPIAFNLWGYKDDLKDITEESLYDYYKKILKENKIDIFIIGKFNRNKITDIFREKFNINTMKMRKFEPFITYKKSNKTIELQETMNGLKQSKLSIICKILNITPFERRYVLPIYTNILGGESKSRLFENLREKESLAYSINALNKNPNSIVIISSGINEKNYDKSIGIIKNEIKKMNNITEEELEDSKNDVLTTLDSLFDNPTGIINYYFSIEVLGSDNIEDRKKNFSKVTKNDVMNLSKKIKIAMIYLLKGNTHEEK